MDADGGEVIVGGTADRPDWLPSWVELPTGLEITTQFTNPGVGEAAVLGVVEGEAQEELLAEVIGSCDLGDGSGNLSADDSYSVFDLFPANGGGLGAVRTATFVVDGERTTYWSVDQSMEVIGLELTDNSIFYEGGMRENVFGAEPEIGTIEIACA